MSCCHPALRTRFSITRPTTNSPAAAATTTIAHITWTRWTRRRHELAAALTEAAVEMEQLG